MKFAGLARKVQNFTADNSPTILTAIGVTGALTGAYLTGKATFRAVEILEDEKQQYRLDGTTSFGKVPADRVEILTRKQAFRLLWKLYIPASGVLTLTCASIICANRIGMRRTATAAAALALTERGWDEYKEKVTETLGKQKEKHVRDKIAQDKVDRNFENQPLIVQTTGKVLLHDEYSGRFFQGTVNEVDRAVNEINRQIGSHFEGHATVSDFYDKIGLENTSLSDEMGWNEKELLVIKWTTCTTPDGQQAAHSFEFESRPQLRPWVGATFRS